MKIFLSLRRKQLKMKAKNTIKQVREDNRALSATNGLIPFIVLFEYSKTRRRYGINFLKEGTALNSQYNLDGGGIGYVVEPLHVDTEAYPKCYAMNIARTPGTVVADTFDAPYKGLDAALWVRVAFTPFEGKKYTCCAVIHGIKSDAEARAISGIKSQILKDRELAQ